MTKPRMPRGLEDAGRALWRRLTDAYELDTWEVVVLEAAARQADDVARLEEQIRRDGIIAPGSKGQPRLAAVVTEVRQGRIALAKLLSELRLPADDTEQLSRTPASRHAQNAAVTRWQRHRRLRQVDDAS